LIDSVKEGTFREDLYYRLKQIEIRMPSLQEYPELISHFSSYFVTVFNQKYDHEFMMTDNLMTDYMNREWSGNIRELKNEIQATIALSKSGYSPIKKMINYPTGFKNKIHALEKEQIQRVLNEQQGNVSKTAKVLGIKRTTLGHKIKKYDIKSHISSSPV